MKNTTRFIWTDETSKTTTLFNLRKDRRPNTAIFFCLFILTNEISSKKIDQFLIKTSNRNVFELVLMDNIVKIVFFFDDCNIVSPCVDLFEHD